MSGKEQLLQSYFDAAARHFRAGAYREAAWSMQAALELDPNSEQAAQYLQKVREIDAALTRAVASYERRDYAECKEALERVAETNPDDRKVRRTIDRIGKLLADTDARWPSAPELGLTRSSAMLPPDPERESHPARPAATPTGEVHATPSQPAALGKAAEDEDTIDTPFGGAVEQASHEPVAWQAVAPTPQRRGWVPAIVALLLFVLGGAFVLMYFQKRKEEERPATAAAGAVDQGVATRSQAEADAAGMSGDDAAVAQPEEQPAATQEPSPGAEAGAESAVAVAARQALELALRGQHVESLQLLDDARKAADDSLDNAALRDTEVSIRLVIARRLMEGGDRSEARAMVEQVLRLDADNEEATQMAASLVEETRAAKTRKAAVAAAPVKRARSRPSRRTARRSARKPPATSPVKTSALSQVEAERDSAEKAPEQQEKPPPAILSVQSQPQADVYLDGARVGVTPIKEFTVAVGSHRVRLEASGYEPKQRAFDAQSGTRTRIDVELKAVEAAVSPPAPPPVEVKAPLQPKPAKRVGLPGVPAASFYVIAHRGTGLKRISATTLRDIFLGSKKYWGAKKRVVPILRPAGHAASRMLYGKALRMERARFDKHWSAMAYSGSAKRPPVVSSVKRLATAVARVSGAIGYVSPEELPQLKGLKLLILPRSL